MDKVVLRQHLQCKWGEDPVVGGPVDLGQGERRLASCSGLHPLQTPGVHIIDISTEAARHICALRFNSSFNLVS